MPRIKNSNEGRVPCANCKAFERECQDGRHNGRHSFCTPLIWKTIHALRASEWTSAVHALLFIRPLLPSSQPQLHNRRGGTLPFSPAAPQPQSVSQTSLLRSTHPRTPGSEGLSRYCYSNIICVFVLCTRPIWDAHQLTFVTTLDHVWIRLRENFVTLRACSLTGIWIRLLACGTFVDLAHCRL